MSSGSTNRSAGRVVPAHESVSVAPGSTAVTRIPDGISSSLNSLVRLKSAALLMLYEADPVKRFKLAVEQMLTMWPFFWLIISLAKNLQR